MQLSVRDVAELLRVSENTVYRWSRQGGLPCCQVNGQARFNRAELLEWATARRMPVPLDLFYGTAGEPEALPALGDALGDGGLIYRVPGVDQRSLLRAIVACIPLPPDVDRDLMLRVLLAREALGSTGVGAGIAIPHPRNPIVLHVPRPLVTLCFTEQPVDFAAMDGQPVFALFTMVSPAPKIHLHLLARLSHALRQPDFHALLVRRASADEIQAAIRRVEAQLPVPAGTAGGRPS